MWGLERGSDTLVALSTGDHATGALRFFCRLNSSDDVVLGKSFWHGSERLSSDQWRYST